MFLTEESEYEELPNIPGLDWNMDSPFFKQLDLNKLPQKKIPFAKPIPKSFEQAWLGNKPMVPVANAPKEEKKGPHMQQQQQKPSRSDGNKGRLICIQIGVYLNIFKTLFSQHQNDLHSF